MRKGTALSSLLQGHPSSLRFGHPDVTTGDTVFPRWDTLRVPHISSAPTQGHPSPGRPAPPCFAAESVRADTLRALPEKHGSPCAHVWAQQSPGRTTLSGSPIRGFSCTQINNRLVACRRGTVTFTSTVALAVRRVVRILTRGHPQDQRRQERETQNGEAHRQVLMLTGNRHQRRR